VSRSVTGTANIYATTGQAIGGSARIARRTPSGRPSTPLSTRVLRSVLSTLSPGPAELDTSRRPIELGTRSPRPTPLETARRPTVLS
jgi:hypothetical protein